ncbi:MAG: hypothetical protein ACK5H2_10790 [Beutenbergiaceae bacterium]
MRYLIGVLAAVTCGLFLSACNPAAPPPEPQASHESSGQPASPPPLTSPEATTDPSADGMPIPGAAVSGGTESAHGYIDGSLGEAVSILDADGAPYADILVSGLGWDPVCTSDDAKEPVNGAYLVVNVEVVWHNEWDAGYGDLTLTAATFHAYRGDTLIPDISGNASTCYDRADTLPALIPGESGWGSIALDVPPGVTSLVLTPAAVDGSVGWEWSVPPPESS